MISKISASILSLDWSDQTVIDQAVMRVSNANFIHFDIADGKFVKEKSFDWKVVEATKLDGTGLQKDVHLMIKSPEKHVKKYLDAGASMVSFHAEACRNVKKLSEKIRAAGALSGLAISPGTAVKKIEKHIAEVDYVLVMTVKPGKGGQKLLKKTVTKIKQIHKKYPAIPIEADGGINDRNAGLVTDAGASILVSGSYIFKSPEPKIAIDLLRNA